MVEEYDKLYPHFGKKVHFFHILVVCENDILDVFQKIDLIPCVWF